MNIRSILLASALLFATTGGAFAQSHQGGYLGLNPGANVAVSHGVVPSVGSGQGGYLGLNPGADITTSAATQPAQGSREGGYLGLIPGAVEAPQQ